MTSIEPMNLESEDLVADRIEQLKTLFPEIATEGDGTVDFEKLRLIMGDEVNEDDERYAFTWPGKRDAIRLSQMPSTATLRPAVSESRSRSGEDGSFDSDNLYIEGDNLEVLKLLQHSYHGKVKMIYIDPPYNTGHDFVYKDSFGDTIGNYKKQAGVAGQSNADTSGRYHSDWCSMMYPRLKLARELLSKNRAIVISIDDNENKNMRMLCDEVFGESNFIVQVIWKKRSTPPNDQIIGAAHEYALIYAKDHDSIQLRLRERNAAQLANYKNPDNHPKGPWTSGDLSANVKGGRYVASLNYPIINPNTGEEHRPPHNGNWRFNSLRMKELLDNDEIFFGVDGKGRPKLKRFLCDVKQGVTYSSLWDFVPLNTQGSSEMNSIFGNQAVFDNPKPIGYIEEFLKLGTDCGDVVLDFFSGSASVAHAIMGLNKVDQKKRKYILVQLPEKTGKGSEAEKAGLSDLCEIGKERIRRAGAKIAAEIEESNAQLKLGESPKPIPDIGFRVFKLDESGINKQDLNAAMERGELFGGDTLLDSVIKPSRSDMDIVFEMMLKWGLELTLPIEAAQVSGYKCYTVAGGELVCCMEAGLTVEALEAIAEMEPRRVLMLDSILTDTLKLNAVQIFKRVGDRTGVEVEIRTV